MTKTQQVAEPTASDGKNTAPQRRNVDPEALLRPAVDIYEDVEGITLVADMPGVSKERLELRMDQGSLIIEGGLQIELPDDMQAHYADVRASRYRRSFALSEELDRDATAASLKDGVLTVRIPKRPEVKPRKIAVRTE